MKMLGRLIIGVLSLAVLAAGWYFYSAFYLAPGGYAGTASFTIREGESVFSLSERLKTEGIVRSSGLFRLYLKAKKIDRKIHPGTYVLKPPLTVGRVAETLATPGLTERTITIIPGWDLRDIAEYFVGEGIATRDELYSLTGEPAVAGRYETPLAWADIGVLRAKPSTVSYEGYLAPDTYRVYQGATLAEIITKLVKERDRQFSADIYRTLESQGRTAHEVLTMASLLEREVRRPEDKAKVADIFWRRHDVGMGLQADSTVHYFTGKKGNVFTTNEDRQADNLWNTYRYPQLPPGPIANPSLDSVRAALDPEPNDYWYFLTTLDTGEVKYAQTLGEHERNIQQYLR
ncbi:MAG: Aminodeoxychorismate lyase [Candidatus Magasanikbacteria bacterium GW2011_GWA2_56_11]|uniref:Endolytic murein transglycosylase n=1 Tax=Candidatus Magasanikbacteria bacterium GW2011_GWA2_56_11 TaxID=1619044 RepID=A0A0G2B7T5_9BACT|nr:MAG: Aminodeoxychorismate lyase [Candidatus Magasanikbacteria bacterium GW2011_GWA2_56_11]